MKRAALSLATLFALTAASGTASAQRPLFRDFAGMNIHVWVIGFQWDSIDPAPYVAVSRHLRNYHTLTIDVDPLDLPDTLPDWRDSHWGVFAWLDAYQPWLDAGGELNVSFTLPPYAAWGDWSAATSPTPADRARAWARSIAAQYGPSSATPVLGAAEIGNEPNPTDWPDDIYEQLFVAMAEGFAEGDPNLTVVNCASQNEPTGTWAKDVNTTVAGHGDLYDALNIHTYSIANDWPASTRSFPEDPTFDYLTRVQALIDWRDANVPDKEIWITEFGWDSSSANPITEVWNDSTSNWDPVCWSDWEGNVPEISQANYLVRSFVIFAGMGIDRAYVYWWADDDHHCQHAAAGITRFHGAELKPSYHALLHQQQVLGDYRFARVLRQDAGDLYAYAFVHGSDPSAEIWVVWSPTGDADDASAGRTTAVSLALDGAAVDHAEQMPAAAGPAPVVTPTSAGGNVSLTVGESPVYLWMEVPVVAPDGGGEDGGAGDGGPVGGDPNAPGDTAGGASGDGAGSIAGDSGTAPFRVDPGGCSCGATKRRGLAGAVGLALLVVLAAGIRRRREQRQ